MMQGGGRAHGSRRGGRLLRMLAGAALLLFSGCATHPFHRHYESGRYEEALAVFREDSALLRQEKALYRAGLLFARPGAEYYEPELAERYLSRLLTRHPRTSRADEVRSVLALLERAESLDLRARRLRTQLEALKAVDLSDTLQDTTRLRR